MIKDDVLNKNAFKVRILDGILKESDGVNEQNEDMSNDHDTVMVVEIMAKVIDNN